MKELEKRIYKYLKIRNWHNLLPGDLAKSIMIEGAELLELFQWQNLSLEEVRADKEKMKEIKEELADVLIYALDMSVLLGFDAEKIIKDKLALNEKKYPNKKAATGDEYWKIKKNHRAVTKLKK